MGSAPAGDGDRLGRWVASTRWPLLAAAVATIPLTVVRQLADPAASIDAALEIAIRLIQLTLALDLIARVRLSGRRWRYLGQHKLDAVTVLFPPLRVVRELAVLQGVFVRPGLQRFVTFATVSIVVGAGVVYAAERGRSGATIDSFGDALWWAAATSTTVGYGDRVPVTLEGRVVAFALMVLGITLFAVLTAHIAAHFVEDEAIDPELLAAIDERLRRMESLLTDLAAPPTSRDVGDPP
jgi:voltage-gated potassium channel